MARAIYTQIRGRWYPVRFPSVQVQSVSKKITGGWTRVAGVWRQFWPPAFPATITMIGAGGGTGGSAQLPGYTGNPGHQINGGLGLSVADSVTVYICLLYTSDAADE